MLANSKEFYGGIVLLVLFFAVLVVMFQPLFGGKNAMAYLDNMYNSISKGSVYYIPQIRDDAKALEQKEISLKLEYKSEVEATQSQSLFKQAGVKVQQNANTLEVTGSVTQILNASLDDAELMYHNKSQEISGKYGLEAKRTMYNWWTSLNLVEKGLKAQEEFKAAKATSTTIKKAVEASYNYFEIEPLKIMDEIGLVIFSLIFYVVYTLWYGFAILFVFEGWGLKLSH